MLRRRRFRSIGGVLVGSVVALVAPQVACAASVLPAGATLTATQSIVSPNGEYTLVMQADGNLVEYLTGGRAIWSSGTHGDTGAHAVMQTNGNLAVLDSGGAVIWSSNSHSAGCASELSIQNDGNVVIYNPSDKAIWATHTMLTSLIDGDVLKPGWTRYSRPRTRC